MKFSTSELTHIVEKSSTINERLGSNFESRESCDQVVNQRLKRWCDLIAEGNTEKFCNRLEWDGLNIEQIRLALGSVTYNTLVELPTWTNTLQECVSLSKKAVYDYIHNFANKNNLLDQNKPRPFEEILILFVCVAKNNLIARIGNKKRLLSDNAFSNLERALLLRLEYFFSPSLELEFSIFRLKKGFNNFHFNHPSKKILSKNSYNDFINQFLEGGIKNFLKEYSVLARFMVLIIDQWIDYVEELIIRFEKDIDEIKKNFCTHNQLGIIVSIQYPLSDYHNNGKSVALLEFESGIKLIYKPRSLKIECAYNMFLDFLNKEKSPINFKTVQVLNHTNYAWVEFIGEYPCESEIALKRYYNRLGALTCLAYLLEAVDLHHENIIAFHEYPVLIDTETLMHPRVLDNAQNNELNFIELMAHKKLVESVFRTNMLQTSFWGSNQNKYTPTDSFFENESTPVKERTWTNINTDTMRLNYEYIKSDSLGRNKQPNTQLQGLSKLTDKYIEEIINGFQLMYSWLQRNKNKILNSQILEKFYYTETRFVFRPTNNYNSLLKKITNPSLMRDGAELSIQIDSLCKVLIQDDSKPLFWSILHEEKCALEKLNFPLFTSHPNTVDLVIKDNKLIEKYFKLPSIDFVTYKLKNFNDEDLKDQVYFIRFSLCKESILKRSHSDKIITSKKIKSKDFTFQKTHKYWQKSVDSLIDNLENSAVYLTEKYITWLVRQYKFLTEQFDPLPISYNFFEGLGGIAFLLTSYNQIIKDNHYEQLTRATLVTCQEILKKSVYEKINQDIGIGIGLGTTSLIYYCTHIAHLANDKEFEKIAKKIALTLTIQNIESDRKFDIILGSSGTILGLLNLYKLSNNSRHIEQAIICGNHLLNNRVSSHSGKLAWETFANKINTGFSHGVAGIAYALLRLYKVTGDNRYKEAAEEAIAYERSVFIPELNNWPDFRQPQTKDNPKCMCSWCHGAPGIGLARVATLDILDTPEIRQDIEAAITTTLNYGLSDIDHLCCGNMGRVEFLFTAGRKLNRPELVDAAMKLASQVVARAEEKGHYGYGPILDFHPGFFQGASGIGYQLLRLAYPDQLPSVLLWE